MKIQRCGSLVALIACAPLFGQAPPQRPEFEVASIRPTQVEQFNRTGAGVHIDGAQVTCKLLSLKDYIGAAYRIKTYQISGPAWLASERFDIAAKLPEGASAKDIPVMLQALLEDRFQMKVHRESKDLPVYALVIGKDGLKMKESPPDSGTEPKNPNGPVSITAGATQQPGGVTVDYGNGSYFTFGNNRIEGRKVPGSNIANALAPFMDRPVVDMTKLSGRYDFVLELSPEDFRAMGLRSAIAAGIALPPQAVQQADAASLDSLFNSLDKLGLKLEARKAPVEILVVDHMEKTPTEN